MTPAGMADDMMLSELPLPEIPDVMADTPLTDRRQVKQRKTDLKAEENKRLETVKEMMRLRPCREFFHWLLEQCRCGDIAPQVVATTGAVDPLRTMVRLGEAQIGAKLIGLLNRAAPDMYIRMMQEAQEKNDAHRT